MEKHENNYHLIHNISHLNSINDTNPKNFNHQNQPKCPNFNANNQDNFNHAIYQSGNIPQNPKIEMQQQIPLQHLPNINNNNYPNFNQQQNICPNLPIQNHNFNHPANQPNILPLTRINNQNDFAVNQDINQEEDHDGKHLCYIITLSLFFGFFAGFYFYFKFRNIRRKELLVGVYLAVCFISTISHLIVMMYFDKLSNF